MSSIGTSWAWPLRRFTKRGGDCQNEVTGRAEQGGGGVRGTDRAKFAPGDAWGGGLVLETRPHMPPSLLLSALLPFIFFNVSFAYFWLAVRLSLDKKLDR